MLEIAPISGVVGLLKQVLDLITGVKKVSDEQFDQLIGNLFSELEKVLHSYFDMFTELHKAIRDGSAQCDFDQAMRVAEDMRAKIVLNRNKVTASFETLTEALEKRRSRAVEAGRDLKAYDYLADFLHSAYGLFFDMQTGSARSLATNLFGELDSLSGYTRVLGSGLPTGFAPERAFHELQDSALYITNKVRFTLESKWTRTCKAFERLKMHKPEVIRAISPSICSN